MLLISNFFSRIRIDLIDDLFKNSFFIMLASFSSSGFGFLFWFLAARLYTEEEVGIATALISSVTLIILISRVGLDFSVIRFMPNDHKDIVINNSIIITTLLALVFGIVYLLEVDKLSPSFVIIDFETAIMFISFLVSGSIVSIMGCAFIAKRKAELGFIQNIILGSKIIFLPLLLNMDINGIFAAFGISFMIASFIGFFPILNFDVKFSLKFDHDFIKNAFEYSLGNYFVNILMISPSMILPLITLNLLGPEYAAQYYIAFSIATILFFVPGSISTSLFVEGSYGMNLRKATLRSIKAILIIQIPIMIFLYFAGEHILYFFGKDYVGSIQLLRLFIISSLFYSFITIYISIKRINKDMKELILISSLLFVLLIGLSYIFILKLGLVGIGYSWLIAYLIVSLFIVIIAKKDKFI